MRTCSHSTRFRYDGRVHDSFLLLRMNGNTTSRFDGKLGVWNRYQNSPTQPKEGWVGHPAVVRGLGDNLPLNVPRRTRSGMAYPEERGRVMEARQPSICT